MSLNQVCYEQIKDNFWYGLFGDFKLVIDKNTGYFNATKLCASGGKRFRNWLANRNSNSLIEYLKSETRPGTPVQSFSYAVNGDNKDESTGRISGTYLSKELILNIASWISPAFYVKCNSIIISYYTQDFNNIKSNNEELKHRVKEAEKSIELVRLKLEPCASPYTENSLLHNCLVIVQKNLSTERFPYYVIRTQKRNLDRALTMVAKKYPDYDIVFKKEQDPNSVKLFRLMVQELPIIACNNSFYTSLTQDELTEKIDELYASLFNID